VDSDQHPRWSRLLLQLPYFKYFSSKRHRVIRHGRHTSIVQTCDSTRMSTEPSIQNNGIPSTPTPTIVNGTHSNPTTTMNVVSKEPIITMVGPIVNAQSTASNPFGSLHHSLGYNVQSIPMAYSHFSYDMPNFNL
jgi:hypothetical protein